ncbi:hypothetical protein [Streptomyces sp. NPDC059076]|uniref:hypothetical protein n=1 Tax=unclassified Streptomyces TaxID=2593676 RepID=UPI0036819DE2
MSRRGRQVVFTPELRAVFLDAVASGMYIRDAAEHVGISVNLSRSHAVRDDAFATALTTARAAGKKARADAKGHSESHYNKQDCRHPQCTAAAREGRARRRRQEQAREAGDKQPPAEVHEIRLAESSHCLPLARVS